MRNGLYKTSRYEAVRCKAVKYQAGREKNDNSNFNQKPIKI